MTGCEFWLVSLPSDKQQDSSFQQVNKIVRKFPGSSLGNFSIPDLRIGTLDHLMSATDDLRRLQESAEILLGKLMHSFMQLLNIERENADAFLKVAGRSMEEYLKKFNWDVAKYPVHLSIAKLEETIEKQLVQIEEDFHKLYNEYNHAYSALDNMERQQKGSLLHRNVSLFVSKDDFVLDSQYLVTVLVAVPKHRYSEWRNCYERIDREVVPRSSVLILEDEDLGLFTVTLFKRCLEAFKHRVRDLKFFVKDFIFDEKRIESERRTLFELRFQKKHLQEPLTKWLKANYSEMYIAFVHLHVLRITVESILRYGLSTKFFCVYISIPKKDAPKLLEAMLKEYIYLDESLKSVSDSSLITSEDIPFVFFKILTHLSELK